MSGGGVAACRHCGKAFTRSRETFYYCSDACRFMAKTSLDGEAGHWIWTAYRDRLGYGQFQIGKRLQYAHRVSYTLFRGPIPQGLVIDHLCRTPACVNPDHLEAVTQFVNVIDRGTSPGAIAFTTNRCHRGHAFTPENTYTRPDAGTRQCRACMKVREQRRVKVR